MSSSKESITDTPCRHKEESSALPLDAPFLHFPPDGGMSGKGALISFCTFFSHANIGYYPRAPPQKSEFLKTINFRLSGMQNEL